MSRGRLRALTLLAILAAPVLAPVSAQTEPDVPQIFLSRRDVLEGENWTMFVNGWATTDRIRIQCRTCPEAGTSWSAPAENILTFPDDFGAEAVRTRQPRWNDTYVVEFLKNGLVPVASAERRVNVTIVDLWRQPDREIEPGDRIVIASSGYPLTNPLPVNVKLTKENGTVPGRRDTIWEWRALQPVNGAVAVGFKFSTSAADALRCPQDPLQRCRNFRIDIEGGGKNSERYNFAGHPARLKTEVLFEPTRTAGTDEPGDPTQTPPPQGPPRADSGVPAKVNRTARLYVDFRLVYRNGFEWLTFLDYPPGKGPTVDIERVASGSPSAPVVVNTTTARWAETAFGWRANWTPPRDLPVADPTGTPYRYRFVVRAQQEPEKNDILRHEFNPVEITPLVIPLLIAKAPTVVQRAQDAVWEFDLLYLDGKPLVGGENTSQLRVCMFPRSEERPGVPCLNRPTFEIKDTGGGRWRVLNRWAVDEPRVRQDWVVATAWTETSPVKDKFGNSIATGELAFNLSIAKPVVSMVTQVGDERRGGAKPFERGDLVKVTATITYPDLKTPFNRTRSADGARLPLLVVQKNSIGDVVAIERVDLANPGDDALWVGSFQIGRTSELAPTGRWELKLDLKDKVAVPNANVSVFARDVVPATILVTNTREPALAVRLGDPVQYRFRLNYRDPHGGVDQRVAGGDQPGLAIRAEVHPWKRGELGPTVETLAPVWDAIRQDWGVEWRVPRHLPLQQYVIVPSGSDLSGNRVRTDVHSRPFEIFTVTLERGVITQPPPRVPRGERVVAVFDGRDGDVGVDSTGLPRIEVQRHDAKSEGWLTEVIDVRSATEPGLEHVAVWNTTLGTQAGLYRFALRGKDAQFAFINATSTPFLVQAVKVERESLSNGTNVTKGGSITAIVERRAGDTVREAYVVQDGKRVVTIPVRPEVDRAVATWQVPFTFPTGAFTVVVRMLDKDTNEAAGEVGPFFVSSADVRSETVIDPLRLAARGEDVEWRFRSFYPSGQKLGKESGVPVVTVVNASGPVAEAIVRFDGTNHYAQWEIPRTVDASDYWLEASGRDAFGNVFLPLRSADFRVEPGVYGRTINLLPPAYNPRATLTGFRVYTDPDDKVLSYSIVRLRATDAAQAINNFQGQVVARGPVRASDDGSLWIAEWRPAKDAPLGWYRFRIDGEDRYGNRIEQYSGAWQITPSQLAVEFFEQARAIEPGVPYTTSFRVRYPGDELLDDRAGRVSVVMSRDGQTVSPDVEVAFDADRWRAAWPTPDPLPRGRYIMTVTGFDLLGNVLLRTATSAADYAPTNLEKLLGVPGPSPLFALLAAAAVAIVVRRRRSA